MAKEFVEAIGLDPSTTEVTGGETTVFTKSIEGGTLGTINTIVALVQGRLSMSIPTTAKFIVRAKYGSLIAAATVYVAESVIAAAGMIIEVVLSADGSPTLQVMHLSVSLGTEVSNIGGVPLVVASGAEDSASDQDLELTFEIEDGSGAGVSVLYDAENTGDGVFSAPPTIGGSAEDGDYELVCTTESAGSGTFSVTSPGGTVLADLTVGTPYSSLHFSGTLVSGATDFIVGDTIIVRIVTVGSKATIEHLVLKKISYIEDAEIPTSVNPNTMILTVSKLNRFPHSLFKDIIFYGEFTHHLDYYGVGEATLARATAQNATWRDGATHSVAANKPRFEYSGSTALGLLINSAVSETLTIPVANNLHNANTLFWKENNVTFYTTVTTNPFDNTGLWTGTDNIHISHVLKFNRVLTAVEIDIVLSIMNTPDLNI